MCNERDRLISYIYDECDARERDAVREHLDTCAECRTEVAGLRSVREDLLAWDVPAHESVWRPFAPAPSRAWWREVPAWAMAAAAGLVLVAGAAGGAAVHAFMPERTQAQGPGAPVLQQPPTKVSLTAADLDALERRLTSRFGDQVGAVNVRLDQVSNRPVPMNPTEQTALNKEVLDLREENSRLAHVIDLFMANTSQIKNAFDLKQAQFESRLKNVDANMTQIANQLNSSGK
jgi:putative zinc finger protein